MITSSYGKVRKAEIRDIPGIISVLEQNLISNKKVENIDILTWSGFLINRFSPEDAEFAIVDEDNFIFLVSTEDNDIIGYIIGCDVKKLNPHYQQELFSISAELKNIISLEKTIYLRHIAKKIDKKSVGKELLKNFLDYSNYKGYKYIICSIAQAPIENKASKNFHEKNGFVCLGYNQKRR